MNLYALFVGSIVTGMILALAWDALTRWAARADATLQAHIDAALAGTDDPIFLELATERDMGPIFEAGYRRQAQRFHAELDAPDAVERLGGGQS